MDRAVYNLLCLCDFNTLLTVACYIFLTLITVLKHNGNSKHQFF